MDEIGEKQMSNLTFAEYLDRRRPSYTQEDSLLRTLHKDPFFRNAASLDDIEVYLNVRNAPFGVRNAVRSAWGSYQAAKRKQRSVRSRP